MAGQEIKIIQKWKYLGITLTEDKSIVPDVDRALGAFLRHFNAISCPM